MATVRPARGPEDLEAVRRLVREYAQLLPEHGVRPDGVLEDLEDLPGDYAPPAGEILLAEVEGEPAGVVVMAPEDPPEVCQMKRLYVRPEHRGEGLGRRLAVELLHVARERGYERMMLGTLEGFAAARRLYEDLGFTYEPIPEKWNWPCVMCMERSLEDLPLRKAQQAPDG